jgi:hypothetical protein
MSVPTIPTPMAYAVLAGIVIVTAALDAGIRIMEGMIVHLRDGSPLP